MPIVDPKTLFVADGLLHTAGVVAGAAWLVVLVRGRDWRNPLRSPGPAFGEPRAIHLASIMFGYGLLSSAGMLLIRFDPEALRRPGSIDWHVAQTLDGIIRLLLSAAMAWVLARTLGPAHSDQTRPKAAAGVLIALLTALIAAPVCGVQLQMGRVIHNLAQPDALPPEHAVLEAIQASAWGSGGVVQLFVSAILVAALAEELFFRGLLLGVCRRYLMHDWLAILFSAVAFGFVHYPQPQVVLPLITLGVILGFVRVRYGSIWICVLAHALFNARTMTLALLNPALVGGP